MDELRTPREPFRFRDPRQREIYKRLLLIGPGPAAHFRDACQIMEGNSNLDAASHLVAHLLREVENALRAVLESIVPSSVEDKGPCSSSNGHKTKIGAILNALGIPHTDPIGKAWLDIAGSGETTLHGRAHRRHLAAPRPIDDEFRRFWLDMQAIFAAVLDRFETRFLDIIPILDELKAKAAPSRKDANSPLKKSLTRMVY